MSSLDPLEEFYRRDGRPLPRLQFLPPEEIPEPYRSLLVHDRDMTPTLEQFHGGRIVLDLIHRRTEPTGLSREVVLVLSGSRKPVEYGAILIHRAPFPS
ncbi:MAG: hypothetical protein FJX77_17840, partial [Armatimonadetes bacterium]|nr:hypothetical protein [Armatimonadota bacterium]